VLECANCSTLNPDTETACLSCGSPLASGPTTGISSATGRCRAGHPVDPSWKTCPYCDRQAAEAAGGGARATRLEGDGGRVEKGTRIEAGGGSGRPVATTLLAGEALRDPPPSAAGAPAPTRLEEAAAPRGRRTLLHDGGEAVASSPGIGAAPAAVAPSAPSAVPGAPPVRRLLAVLAAPDLGAGGALFAIRSGRNTLGSGRGNDIVFDGESEVSREHAVILHRNDTFHLADRLSTNGTWVNGLEVPANGTVPLADRDRIRLGRTELIFLRLDPPVAASSD
jgi:FHA domain